MKRCPWKILDPNKALRGRPHQTDLGFLCLQFHSRYVHISCFKGRRMTAFCNFFFCDYWVLFSLNVACYLGVEYLESDGLRLIREVSAVPLTPRQLSRPTPGAPNLGNHPFFKNLTLVFFMKHNDKLAKQVGYQGQHEDHLTLASQPAVWCPKSDGDPVYQ